MGVITNIIPTKRNKGQMVEIFLDDSCLGLVHMETMIKFGLVIGKEFDNDELLKVVEDSNTIVAMEQMLKLLSKFLKTEKQCADYLRGKGYSINVINSVITKLKEYKYINDENYAKQYLETYKYKKGKRAMSYDLGIKGIEKTIIEQALSNISGTDDVVQNIANKYMKNKDYTYKNKNKLLNHLASKGFEYDEIMSVINNIGEWKNEDRL